MAEEIDALSTLEKLEERIRTLLPEQYQDTYEAMQPVSMGSASLQYGDDGKVAWGDIWESFCDLAMAGGPPHKGSLLDAALPAEIDAQADQYREVLTEICRGIALATDLAAQPSPHAGWVRIDCDSHGMAKWLQRAIVMENVSCHREGLALDLPAGPAYRLEREIKNVITVIAKTYHYWDGHVWYPQRQAIANLLSEMEAEQPLIEPARSAEGAGGGHPRLGAAVVDSIQRITGLQPSSHRDDGWLGLEVGSVRAAVWMMRMLIATNVLSRREGTVLFVPLNPVTDVDGEAVTRWVGLVHRFARDKGLLSAAATGHTSK